MGNGECTGRGGRRAGAGRKRTGRVPFSATVLPETAERLRSERERTGRPYSHIIDELVFKNL